MIEKGELFLNLLECSIALTGNVHACICDCVKTLDIRADSPSVSGFRESQFYSLPLACTSLRVTLTSLKKILNKQDFSQFFCSLSSLKKPSLAH